MSKKPGRSFVALVALVAWTSAAWAQDQDAVDPQDAVDTADEPAVQPAPTDETASDPGGKEVAKPVPSKSSELDLNRNTADLEPTAVPSGERAKQPSVLESWWFWTAATAVVLTTAAVVLAVTQDDDVPHTTLGNMKAFE